MFCGKDIKNIVLDFEIESLKLTFSLSRNFSSLIEDCRKSRIFSPGYERLIIHTKVR